MITSKCTKCVDCTFNDGTNCTAEGDCMYINVLDMQECGDIKEYEALESLRRYIQGEITLEEFLGI